jgi:SAM-dependent methyltransferase
MHTRDPVAILLPPAPEPVCPACRSGLSPTESALTCSRCGCQFSLVAGIPDLRLTPDAEDLSRALALAGRFEHVDFAELLREGGLLQRGSISQNPVLRERFVAHNLGLVGASTAYLAALESELGATLGLAARFLEIGCGTGALAGVAANRGARVVATDISMRALVLAKKRLTEAGITTVRLVCCSGEEPSFPPGSFDIIAASDVIEHTAHPDRFLAACSDLLAPGGTIFLATPNRFSLSLEPHVRLWGVGFLPRWLARRYVQALRKVSYDGVYPLSAPQLRRLLASQGLESKIVVPEIPAATQAHYSGLELQLVRAYNRLRAARLVRLILLAVGPFFHVFGRKRLS